MKKYPWEGEPSWSHSNVGAHLHPYGYHSWTLSPEGRAAHLPVLERIGASWVLALTEGMAAVEVVDGKPAMEWYLERGIVPIVRDLAKLDRPFQNEACVEALVDLYAPYGLRPTFQCWNELGDDREWDDKPPNWREVALERVRGAIPIVLRAGANFGFADPLGDWAWWFDGLRDWADEWRDGRIVFVAHPYGKARPIDYPEDDVSRYGTPLTEAGYAAALDDFWPEWADQPLEAINAQRAALADPGKTWRDDSTCFNAWRHVRAAARDVLGCEIAMAMGEGVWTPDDRAGDDVRYPRTTPRKVAARTLQALLDPLHGMYGMCFWLLWGGESANFQSDFWLGSNFSPEYGWEMPVVETLELARHAREAGRHADEILAACL